MIWGWLLWLAVAATLIVSFEWANRALDARKAKNGGDWRG